MLLLTKQQTLLFDRGRVLIRSVKFNPSQCSSDLTCDPGAVLTIHQTPVPTQSSVSLPDSHTSSAQPSFKPSPSMSILPSMPTVTVTQFVAGRPMGSGGQRRSRISMVTVAGIAAGVSAGIIGLALASCACIMQRRRRVRSAGAEPFSGTERISASMLDSRVKYMVPEYVACCVSLRLISQPTTWSTDVDSIGEQHVLDINAERHLQARGESS